MRKRTRREVLHLADKHGGKVDIKSEAPDLHVAIEAPAGHIWSSFEVHELVSSQWDDDPTWTVWNDLYEGLAMGTEECTVPDCEWCADSKKGV